jgi:hypothetical protein
MIAVIRYKHGAARADSDRYGHEKERVCALAILISIERSRHATASQSRHDADRRNLTNAMII